MASAKAFPLRPMILSSVLIGTQIVLARFAGIQVSDGLRISLETIPLILGSLWLGPVWGAVIAVLADILGTILSGYGVYFPLLTVGPVLLTVIVGLSGKSFGNIADGGRFCLKFIGFVLLAELVNTLFGTWALTVYYSRVVGIEKGFGVLLAARAAAKAVTIPADTVLSLLLHRILYPNVVTRYLSASGKRNLQ